MSPVETSICVRKVNASDLKHAEKVWAVVHGAYRCKGGWTSERGIVSGQRATLDDIQDYIVNNGDPNVLLCAFEKQGDSETAVGTILIMPWDESPQDAKISLFSVDTSYQSRGIGRLLMQGALQEMKAMGYSTAVLQVFDNRPELYAWYEKLGFVYKERTPFMIPELLIQKDVKVVVMRKPLID